MTGCLPRRRRRTNNSVGRLSTWWLTWAACVVSTVPFFVNELSVVRAADKSGSTTLYRRVYVPADNVEAWPRGEEKYLPIEAREFERLIRAANSRSAAKSLVTIEKAEYWARFDGKRLVDCRGEWNVMHRGDGPALLPLTGMSMVVRNPTWKNQTERPARLGSWGENDVSADNLALETTESGDLAFDWLVPWKTIHGGIEIDWRLPIAAEVCLNLDLPNGVEPQLEGAVVLDKSPLPPAIEFGNLHLLRWRLALNPNAAEVLRITDAAVQPVESSPAPAFREKVNYRISQQGLDIEASWNLDESVHDRRELTMELPKGARLLSATSGGHELIWRIAKNRASREVAVFKLPGGTERGPLQIQLHVWRPIVLDQKWTLPKLRPEGVFWESGNFEVVVDPQLEMVSLDCADSVQTGVTPATNGTEPEIYRLASYSPSSMTTVQIAEREPEAAIRLVSSLALTDPDIAGRLVAKWDVHQGCLHRLAGELASGWIIESLETQPADILGEWFIDEHDGRRRIEIQLQSAVRPGQGITLTIAGRLQRDNVSEPIDVKTLRMVDWTAGRTTQHLMTFQTAEPYTGEPVGGLPIVSWKTISDEDSRLLQASEKGVIFELAGAGKKAGLKILQKRGQYDADIRLDVVCSAEHLSRRYLLAIHPATNGIDRAVVYSNVPLGDVRWTERSHGTELAAERLAADDPRWVGLPKNGELWLVRLPWLTTQTVEVMATIATPWPARKELPLLSLPEAVEQRGTVGLYADSIMVPMSEPVGLESAALPLDPARRSDDTPLLRAAYWYDPSRLTSMEKLTQLWMKPSAVNNAGLLTTKHAELESFYWPSGRATHRATYELSNDGATRFLLNLPERAVVRAILVDGQALSREVGGRPGHLSSISLRPEVQSTTVEVDFDIQQAPLSAGVQLLPPLIHGDIPVLSGHWTVWLPEEYSTDIASVNTVDGEFDWRRRLFGPLGRPPKEKPFDPLNTRDWARLLSPLGSLSLPTETDQSEHLGWTAYSMDFVAEKPDAVRVAHPPAVTTWGIVTFLLCFIAGGRIRQHSGRAFIALLATAAALSLISPIVFAPIAAAAVLGLLLSLVVRWRGAEPYPTSSHSWSRISTVSVPGVLLAALTANSAWAELAPKPDAALESGQATPIERVLIPVDAAGRATGSKLFVSERFLRTLLRSEDHASRRWVLCGAEYTGEIRERVESTGIVAADWTMAFDIQVLARDTTIVLPLVRSQATWQEAAMLDGVPVPIVWRNGGRECAIRVDEPGRYLATLKFVPRIARSGRHTSVRLAVPSLAGARLKLQYPKSLPAVVVTGMDREARTVDEPGLLAGHLSATGLLELQWPSLSLSPTERQGLRVTSMRWLRIGANEVALQTKYIVEGGPRRPDELVVAYDRRWGLVNDDKQNLSDIHEETDGRLSVRVPLPADEVDRQEITLQWHLLDAAPFGRLRLPSIELISTDATQRWLAISTDPAVECEIIGGAASAATVNEFLAMWGEAESPPQLVIGTLSTRVPWDIAVRPRASESLVAEVLHVAAGRQRLHVAYQADVVPGRSHEHQFRLIVPKDLAVDEVSLIGSGRRIPARWSRVGDDRLNIFFGESLTTEYRIWLQGTVPAKTNAVRSVPRVTAAAVDSAMQSLQLYRDEDVLVELRGISEEDRAPEGPRGLPPVNWTARPAGVYRLDKTGFDAASLRITPNKPQIIGPTVVSLVEGADGWWTGIEARFSVERGKLETLTLRKPATWVGPFAIESDVPASMELDTSDTGDTSLVIRFANSIGEGESVEFSIRGPMAPAIQTPVSVPNIVVEPFVRGDRFVVVPARVGGRPVVWSEEGVRQAGLPADLGRKKELPRENRTFEVVDTNFRVATQLTAASQPASRVRLVDTTIWSMSGGAQSLETRMTIAAPELAQCTLLLPPDQELVSVRVDGSPAVMRPVDAQTWELSVGPTRLPRTIAVVTSVSSPNSRIQKYERPMLLANGEAIPVDVSLWALESFTPTAMPRISGANTFTEAEHRAFRLERLVNIAEAATPDAVETPQPEGYYWFRRWANQLLSLRKEAVENIESVRSDNVSQVSASAEEQLTRASERLDRWIEECGELLAVPGLEEEPAADGTRLLEHLEERTIAGGRIYCVAEGGASTLVVDSVAAAATPGQIRMIGLMAIGCAAVTSIWLMNRPATADFLYRWPHAVTFLVGIVYWAWLWPSWLGIVIAAWGLASIGLFGWPGRSLPMERSTVLRVPRNDAVAP